MTKDQIVKVENRMHKGKNRLIFVSIIMTLLIFISFFVPLGFLPNKRGHAFSELQKELTLSQSIGLLPTLIRHTKYLKLKKDLKEKGTLTFETKIIRVVELLGDAEKEFDVFLE